MIDTSRLRSNEKKKKEKKTTPLFEILTSKRKRTARFHGALSVEAGDDR
jgi:hypothetical protein